jgi:hypothetical protein
VHVPQPFGAIRVNAEEITMAYVCTGNPLKQWWNHPAWGEKTTVVTKSGQLRTIETGGSGGCRLDYLASTAKEVESEEADTTRQPGKHNDMRR